MVEIDVKIQAKDLYNYMMAHSYSSASGLLGSCVGGLMVVMAFMSGQWIFLIGGVILLLYLPWTLNIKSKQQVLNNPTFKNILHYTFDEEGISVSQGAETQKQAWEDMYKAISTCKVILFKPNEQMQPFYLKGY